MPAPVLSTWRGAEEDDDGVEGEEEEEVEEDVEELESSASPTQTVMPQLERKTEQKKWKKRQ